MPSTTRRYSADRYDDPTAHEKSAAPTRGRRSSSDSEDSDDAGGKEAWDDEEAVGETSLPARRKDWVMHAISKGGASGQVR